MARSESGRSGSLRLLFRTISRKAIITMVRYPVDTASQFVGLFVLFLLVFFGGTAVGGQQFSDSLEGVVIGFFLFTVASGAYAGVANNVSTESEWGTLERLYISPYRFGTVVAVDALVNVVISLLWAVVLLMLMMGVTGRWLSVDPLTVVPLLLATVAPVLGLGFAFGGAALVYKRIESVFQLVQFAFVALIAAPVGEVWALRLLPASHGAYLTRRAIESNRSLLEFPPGEIALVFATATVYLVFGYYVFVRAATVARDRGVMGHY